MVMVWCHENNSELSQFEFIEVSKNFEMEYGGIGSGAEKVVHGWLHVHPPPLDELLLPAVATREHFFVPLMCRFLPFFFLHERSRPRS